MGGDGVAQPFAQRGQPPILVGLSRKSFIGKILNAQPQERLFGSVSTCVLAAQNGAQILRVHDVKEVTHRNLPFRFADTALLGGARQTASFSQR
jgi:hypothetical protein